MEKTRVSCRVELLMIIIGLFCLLSCKNDDTIIHFESPDNKLFSLKNEYLIKSDSVTNIIRLISSDNNDFYFSDLFTRSIYKTERPFKSFEKFGQNGQGPAEYLTPFYIDVYNRIVYWSSPKKCVKSRKAMLQFHKIFSHRFV